MNFLIKYQEGKKKLCFNINILKKSGVILSFNAATGYFRKKPYLERFLKISENFNLKHFPESLQINMKEKNIVRSENRN